MAKNSLGEFAGGNTSSALNPWKLDRTSFGSSSGTVSAAVAGLIGFGIGTETGGSIVYPPEIGRDENPEEMPLGQNQGRLDCRTTWHPFQTWTHNRYSPFSNSTQDEWHAW